MKKGRRVLSELKVKGETLTLDSKKGILRIKSGSRILYPHSMVDALLFIHNKEIGV